jgi:ribosomal protein S18 acetylase RimI-like enzyme
MITYTTSTTDKELSEILGLQKSNLPQNLTDAEIKSQGFVTVSHTFNDLKKLNDYEQHLIIKDGDKIAGYLLAMTQHSKHDIAILIPMFEVFDKTEYKNKLISSYNYIVVGQVCIDKDYRGRGLLDKAYEAYKNHFKEKYDFAITEIATSNTRSINAHKRIGFSEIHRYTDRKNIEWSIVIWDWK